MVPPDIPSEMSNLLPLIGGLGWLQLTRAGGDDGLGCRKTWLSSSVGSFILGMRKLLSLPLCLCLPSPALNTTHLIRIVFRQSSHFSASESRLTPRTAGLFVCVCVWLCASALDRQEELIVSAQCLQRPNFRLCPLLRSHRLHVWSSVSLQVCSRWREYYGLHVRVPVRVWCVCNFCCSLSLVSPLHSFKNFCSVCFSSPPSQQIVK